MRSQLLAARAAALFASNLPTGSRPSGPAVDAAIAAAVRAYGGTCGCVATLAAAYGDYPETSVAIVLRVLRPAQGNVVNPGVLGGHPDQ